MSLPEGTFVDQKYEIERRLGAGGMGEVYSARHVTLQHRVAIKILRAESLNDEDMQRFFTEAKSLACLDNDHVVRVSDFGQLPDHSPYAVMELLTGDDLDTLLQQRRRLPLSEAVDLILQACVGLAVAHREGIVHRDIKPANLFLARKSDGTKLVKVIDFGLAKSSFDQKSLTQSNAIFGSPTYMSPEQLRASKFVDPRTDIWSLGVTLYELVSGKLPFDDTTAPVYFSGVLNQPPFPLKKFGFENAAFESALLRSLEKDVASRYGSVVEFASAIGPFGGEKSTALMKQVTGASIGILRSERPPPPPGPSTSRPPSEPDLGRAGFAHQGETLKAMNTGTVARETRKAAVFGGGIGAIVVLGLAFTLLRTPGRGPPAPYVSSNNGSGSAHPAVVEPVLSATPASSAVRDSAPAASASAKPQDKPVVKKWVPKTNAPGQERMFPAR